VAYDPDDGEVKQFDGSNWTVVPMWDFAAEYIKGRASAAAKREMGALEAAELQDRKAQEKLDRKMDKLEMQQGQGRRYGVITPERAKGVNA
jgi:hypothetical protein